MYLKIVNSSCRMLRYAYTSRNNEIFRYIHLALCRRYETIKSRRLKPHSVLEVIVNEKFEIRIVTKIKADINIQHDKPDIFVTDKKRIGQL